MLCDVALGNMYERYHADYIEKLPKGSHSCKGVGKVRSDRNTRSDFLKLKHSNILIFIDGKKLKDMKKLANQKFLLAALYKKKKTPNQKNF